MFHNVSQFFTMFHNASQCFNIYNSRPLLRPPLHARFNDLLLLPLHYLELPRIYSSPLAVYYRWCWWPCCWYPCSCSWWWRCLGAPLRGRKIVGAEQSMFFIIFCCWRAPMGVAVAVAVSQILSWETPLLAFAVRRSIDASLKHKIFVEREVLRRWMVVPLL